MASFPIIHVLQGRRKRGAHVLAAVTRSPGEMVIEDVSVPGPARVGNVILRPEAVGICGSDFHLYSGDVGALSGARDFYPRIQGHEVSAIVEDPGEAGAQVGQRVAVFPLMECGRCYPCRAGRPNVCVSLRLVGVHSDGGLQERLEVPAAVDGGARVFSVDPVQSRRDIAKRLGAESAEPPAGLRDSVRDWTRGEGPPLILETSGEPDVLPLATEMVSSAGRVVVVGMSSAAAVLRPGAFPEKEIDVIGSSCATAEDFRHAIRLVSAHRTSLTELFSHHFPLTRAAEAFEFAISRPPDAIKILVTMN
jgi:threonine dehydrogenase-like Zn-dependent dehydrogenase